MKLFSRQTLLISLFLRCNPAISCTIQNDVMITAYGSASAPTKDAYPYFLCNGQTLVPGSMGKNQNTVLVSGDGSYTNPAVMASSVFNPHLPPCTVVYIPWVQKYFQLADRCKNCSTMWESEEWHVDLWLGPNPADFNPSQVPEMTTCEVNWSVSFHDIILNPLNTYNVQPLPLDDGTTCYSPIDPNSRAFADSSFTGSCAASAGAAPVVSSTGTPTTLVPVVTPTA